MSINRDFTMITNNIFRYAARICGSTRNAYLLCMLKMHQFGNKNKKIYYSDGKMERFMNLDHNEFLNALRDLHEQGLIKITGEVCQLDDDALMKRIERIKADDAAAAELTITGGTTHTS